MVLVSLTSHLTSGHPLSTEQMHEAMTHITSGTADAQAVADFLLALKAKGETAEEIAAAAQVLRGAMIRLPAPADAIDVCGTGGDGSGSLNISTATAIVVAACGVPVAKHGNRSISSKSGSSDVLTALGVNIDAAPDVLQACLAQANICFMAAPHFHPAMRHVAPIRQQLKTRTIFNLLGPLCNPAGVTRQLLGVYAPDLVETIAHALHLLGSESAWVVHGMEGLDEISISGETRIARLESGTIATATITPDDAQLPPHPTQALAGGDATHNAHALKDLLGGTHSAYRDAVLINAAAALVIADRATELEDGAALAAAAIDDGRALKTLERLVEISNGIE